MEKVQHYRVDPSSCAVAISVKSVEADLHPFEERDPLDVIDRPPLLKGKAGMIRAQWQPPLRRQSPQIDLHSAPGASFVNVAGSAARGAIEVAITHGYRRTAHIEKLFAPRSAWPPHGESWDHELIRNPD